MNRKKIKVEVSAKVNLSLNICGASDKMHSLDSVMASVNFTDAITVCERFDSLVNIEFSPSNIAPKINTVSKTIDLLRAQFGDFGVDVFVEKRLPIAGGLGGSSADSAGAFVALDNLFNLSARGLKIAPMALQVGSDVPYMLEGGFGRVVDYGETIKKIKTNCEFFLCLASGDLGVSSGASYARFDQLHSDKRLILTNNDELVTALENGKNLDAVSMFSNALTAASATIEPSIFSTLESVKKTNCINSFMSGSGSVCVGVYDSFSMAERAEKTLQNVGLWAKAVKTVSGGIKIL